MCTPILRATTYSQLLQLSHTTHTTPHQLPCIANPEHFNSYSIDRVPDTVRTRQHVGWTCAFKRTSAVVTAAAKCVEGGVEAL